MNVPDVRVYDREMEFLGVSDEYTSLQWIRKFCGPGSFELHCPITGNNMDLLRRENLVWIQGKKEAGVIESLQYVDSAKKTEIMVSGRFLSSYMDRRLIRPFYQINNGLVEKAMRDIFSNALPIPRVELGALMGFTDKITFQATYKNLLTYEKKLSTYANIGFRFRPDFDERKIYFELYKGVDHSSGQSDNPRVIFSTEYGNLESASYSENDQIYKNVCYVGGQGEGTARTFVTVGDDTVTGLDRREVFLSATDITKQDKVEETVDGKTTERDPTDEEKAQFEANYKAQLSQRGTDELAADIVSKATESTTVPNGNFVYGVDYDLGDIVTVEHPLFNLHDDLRLTEMDEIYENGKYTINPVFGSLLPETIDWKDS